MDTVYLVKNGHISIWNGIELGGSHILEAELVEAFGYKALEEINRFGSYKIVK